MPEISSVANLRAVPMTSSRQLRDSIHLDTLAECLYETAGLCDRILFEPEERMGWARLSQSDKAKYRYLATFALNSLSASRRHEAILRSREHVALSAHYGKAFHLLPGIVKRKIAATVDTAVNTYLRVLEGFFEPLHPSMALELELSQDEDTLQ